MTLLDALKCSDCALVLPAELLHSRFIVFDLSTEHSPFATTPADEWQAMTDKLLAENSAKYAIGRYGEKRFIYQSYAQFKAEEVRNIHLGIDITVPSGTAVFSPLDATVHSVANNNLPGDYGGTIILQHQLDSFCFYTLYGHVSVASTLELKSGMVIKKGEHFTEVGTREENGGWVPHLHLQLIKDIGQWQGDYPGVCSEEEQGYWLGNSPDPSVLIKHQKN